MPVDVHAHLDFPQFDADRDEVVGRAAKENILIVNSGLGTEGIGKTLEMMRSHGNVYASLGLTPTEFDESKIKQTTDLIRENIDCIVAIGEVGLDHYWVKDEVRKWQQAENFRRFIELSDEVGLPLVIHSRDAEADAIKMLRDAGKKALMHCFGGTLQQAKDAISDGHIISIPANVVSSKQKQELAKALPLEKIVVETDSPYLAPVPKTRNEPLNVKAAIEKIAALRGVAYGEVEKATTENAKRFFGIRV